MKRKRALTDTRKMIWTSNLVRMLLRSVDLEKMSSGADAEGSYRCELMACGGYGRG
jgi:hypothetical protein